VDRCAATARRSAGLIGMHKFLIAAGLLCLVLPNNAWCAKKKNARNEGDRVEKFLRQHDRDHNGTIERSEFEGKRKRFARVDSNHDGKLTKSELEKAAAHRNKGRARKR
jgi:Ca2+-binding EF-hand superfamily protein